MSAEAGRNPARAHTHHPMDNDLDGQAWDDLGELFPKNPSPSSALLDFQVQLNGELALDEELNTALPDGDVRLDGDLNPVPAAGALSPNVSSPTPATGASPARSRAVSPPKAEPESAQVAPKTETVPASPVAAASVATKLSASGVTKPTPGGTLKAKRAREAAQYPSALLSSLEGTTSAEVRKMSAKERDLVMYKRKLRNRESARRSRARRQATVAELQDEMGDLLEIAAGVVDAGIAAKAENVRLRGKLDVANATIRALKAVYAPEAKLDAQPVAAGTEATVEPVSPPDSASPADVEAAAAAKQAAFEEEFMPSMMQMGG